MSDSSRKEAPDQRDDDPGDNYEEEVESPGKPWTVDTEISSTDDDFQKKVAELKLVDALLDSMSNRSVDEREQRIRGVMQAIHGPVRVAQPKVYLARWMPLAAAAAAILIAVALFSVHSARNALASGVLSAVNKASSMSIDRVYAIQRVLGSQSGDDPPRGTLYLRGREGLLVIWGGAILGRDRSQFWLLTEQQHVTVSDSFDWIDADGSRDQVGVRFLQELSLSSIHVPLMQLASVAELMQHDYEVSLSRVWLNGEAVDLLAGQRRSPASELPRTIQLWADAESRIIRRAELSWEPGNVVILELAAAESIPADWYSYSAHCSGEPIVRRISSGK